MFKDMIYRVSVSSFIVCFAIVLRIELAVALSWKNASTKVISCEHDDVRLTWEYELHPVEYVKAKTWFTQQKETAKEIAHYKDTDGLKISPEYIERVTMIGNDSLLLKDVTTSDEGQYTLIVIFPLSSAPDPRLTLNLTVYVPPLEGRCKPTIHQLENRTGLRADLHCQACGIGPLYLKWRNASGSTANGDVLMFESTEVNGTFRVCVAGPTVEKCFKGRHESLCQEEYIGKKCEETKCEVPKIKEQDWTVIAVLATLGILIVLTESVVLIIVLNWRRINKYRASLKPDDDDENSQPLISAEEEKMDKATLEMSHTMYVVYNSSKELALQKMKTASTALENSEIMYTDNESFTMKNADILTANHEIKVNNPSYEQCVYHKDKQLKLLIVQGDLGIGKTDWCRKFVKIWCEAYERQYLGTLIENESEGIRTLNSFRLLFLMSLRNVEKRQTLKEIIKQQCMMGRDIPNGELNDILDLVMKKRPEKLIFIIHGADEADADVSFLNEILFETKNSLTILTCRDWRFLQSKYGIREEDHQPMACITLKHIDTENLLLYASRIFDAYGYPQDGVSEFMGWVSQNQLEQLMKEPYFAQQLIKMWKKGGMLPADVAEVCLCLIDHNLEKQIEQLREYNTLNMDLDVPRFIPKARGKNFVIKYGKVLCSLGKVALLCMQNKESKNMFFEDNLMTYENINEKRLPEICTATMLVYPAPVCESGKGKKRLCFRHSIIQLFLVAFYLACGGESLITDTQRKENKIIQKLLISLTSQPNEKQSLYE